MLPELTSAYNSIILGVPHCYPIRVEDFASAAATLNGGEQANERLHSEAAFVVRGADAIQGLGRYLLQRALREMHGAGYRHAAISTHWRNYRAFLFYSNYGYRVVDWTYGLRREIQ